MKNIFVLYTLLFLSSNAYAGLWSTIFGAGDETSFESSTEYSFPSCQPYNSEEEKSYLAVCENNILSLQIIENSQPQTLSEQAYLISNKLNQEHLLTDVRNYILQSLDKKISFQKELQTCFNNLAENRPTNEWCKNKAHTLREEARSLHPRMRMHMAFERPSAPVNIVEITPFTYNPYIFHERNSTNVETIQEHEVPLLRNQYEEETLTYSQEWFKIQVDAGRDECIAKDDDGMFKVANESCQNKIGHFLAGFVNYRRVEQSKEHQNIYRDIVGNHPHLVNFNKSKLPDNDNELNKMMSDSFNTLISNGTKELERLTRKKAEDFTFVFRYPNLIEAYLQEKGSSQLSCDGLQALHNRYGEGGFIDLVSDIGLALAAIAGGGACILGSGLACAGIVAIAAEGAFLAKDQYRLNEGIALHSAGLIDSSRVDELESNRNFSIALAPLAFVGLEGGKGIARGFARRHLTREALKDTKHWLYYNATTVAQNSSWIRLAKSRKADLFFDVENGALKRLNDTLGDKNIVTALTNMHKHLLFNEIELLAQKFPGLKFEKYSDFKSSRFAFSFPDGKVPANFQEELDQAMKRVGELFDTEARKINGLDLSKEVPHSWFSAGIGESADQAGLAARQGRQGRSSVVDFKNISAKLEEVKGTIETQRNYLVENLPKSLLHTSAEGITIPSEEVFEVMRKAKGKTDRELVELFQQKFATELSLDDISSLKKYTEQVDQFSPGLWIEKRVVANLDDAEFGGFSADFKGMGAKNMQQLALDLAHPTTDLAATVDKIRSGEEVVTKAFDTAKSSYQALIDRELKRIGVPVRNVCSGDDCVSIPAKELTAHQERELVKSIAQSSKPDGLRLSFIPPGIANRDRTLLAVHGELVEKELRSQLTGFNANQIAPEIMSNVTIAIKMPRSAGDGPIELIIANGDKIQLSPETRRQIESSLAGAVEKVNKNLIEEMGESFTYASAY